MFDFFSGNDFVIFTTRDYAAYANLSQSAASKMLTRLQGKKLIDKISRGIWARTSHPYFHPLSCVPYLLGKEKGYVSFLTALHLYGMLSQIPATIQIASTGHSRRLKSSVGVFEFIQLKPELMFDGVVWSDTKLPFLQATPEKAFIDVLYISTRKNKRFSKLPELTFDKNLFNKNKFDQKAFDRLSESLPLSSRILNSMKNKTNDIQRSA